MADDRNGERSARHDPERGAGQRIDALGVHIPGENRLNNHESIQYDRPKCCIAPAAAREVSSRPLAHQVWPIPKPDLNEI